MADAASALRVSLSEDPRTPGLSEDTGESELSFPFDSLPRGSCFSVFGTVRFCQRSISISTGMIRNLTSFISLTHTSNFSPYLRHAFDYEAMKRERETGEQDTQSFALTAISVQSHRRGSLIRSIPAF